MGYFATQSAYIATISSALTVRPSVRKLYSLTLPDGSCVTFTIEAFAR